MNLINKTNNKFEEWYLSLHGSFEHHLIKIPMSMAGLDVIYEDSSVQMSWMAWEKSAEALQWITVDDRLPEFNEWVLCITSSGSHGIAARDTYYADYCDSEWVDDGEGFSVKKVTHWMPLPSPPKE